MEQNIDLQKVAADAKDKVITNVEGVAPEIINDEAVDANTAGDMLAIAEEEPVIVIGGGEADTDDSTGIDADLDLESETAPSIDSDINDEDLKASMPDLDPKDFAAKAAIIRANLVKYRKMLILTQGMTPEDAAIAAKSRLMKLGKDENDGYLKEHPNLAVVEIDRTHQDTVVFTDEEKKKLSTAKAIRLVLVEDKDLKNIKLSSIPSKEKSTYLQTIDGSLSRYMVPLPILGDFVTFRGAQIIQLASLMKYKDETPEELTNKKAALIYNCLANGSFFQKTDGSKLIMSYNDFINAFPYPDMDMAIYGILVASSMEEMDSPELECRFCQTKFHTKYKLTELLKLDDMSDKFKEIMDTILGHKFDRDTLEAIHEKNDVRLRFQSPCTNNIYDIQYPSIAKAIQVFSSIDETDSAMVYYSPFAMYIKNIYVYDKINEDYILVEDTDIKLLLETLQALSQNDLTILQDQLAEMIYTPQFILKSKCTHCAADMENPLEIDDLVFLTAQGMEEVMRQSSH